MAKQTAVEWLIKQWPILESQLPPQLISQALAMEKEQIVEAHGKRVSRTLEQGIDVYGIRTGEQYYEETFRGVDD